MPWTRAQMAAPLARFCTAEADALFARDEPLPPFEPASMVRLQCVSNAVGCILGKVAEPAIAPDVTGAEIDRSVRQQLRTLSKENAEGVAQHLVMVAALLEAEDLDGALAHAETAVRRAGRVPAAREALGFVAYRMGDFARALTEFRTVRRLSGSSHLLPLMVDCQRALGRSDKAMEEATSDAAAQLDAEGCAVLCGLLDVAQVQALAAGKPKPCAATKTAAEKARLRGAALAPDAPCTPAEAEAWLSSSRSAPGGRPSTVRPSAMLPEETTSTSAPRA